MKQSWNNVNRGGDFGHWMFIVMLGCLLWLAGSVCCEAAVKKDKRVRALLHRDIWSGCLAKVFRRRSLMRRLLRWM